MGKIMYNGVSYCGGGSPQSDSKFKILELNAALTEAEILEELKKNEGYECSGFFYNTDQDEYCEFEGLYSGHQIGSEVVHFGYCHIRGLHKSDYNIDYTIDDEDGELWYKNTNIMDLKQNLTTSDGTPFRVGKTEDGKMGYIINEGGADTVIPFKKELFTKIWDFDSSGLPSSQSSTLHILVPDLILNTKNRLLFVCNDNFNDKTSCFLIDHNDHSKYDIHIDVRSVKYYKRSNITESENGIQIDIPPYLYKFEDDTYNTAYGKYLTIQKLYLLENVDDLFN